MSEVASGVYTHLKNPLVEKEWETLYPDSVKFGETFYVPRNARDALPGFEKYARGSRAFSELVDTFLDAHPEHVGGDYEFIRWNIAARACWAGITGDVSVGQTPSDVEQWLIVENTENYRGPEPAKKIRGQAYYEMIFSPKELAKYAAFWYRIGAADRLDGTIQKRLEDQIKEQAENEWPLLSEALDEIAMSEVDLAPEAQVEEPEDQITDYYNELDESYYDREVSDKHRRSR